MSAELLDALRRNPLRQEWVDELRDLLDAMENFSDNDQRARFLLDSNFMRDNGVAIVDRSRRLDVELGGYTIFEVGVACDSGCGREVTHHGIAAINAAEAEEIARCRMAAEGWEEADGFHCRACMLKRSGWQSQPGPAERGRAMSVEAIPHQYQSGIVRALTADFRPRFTDHSTPEGCGCGERDQGTPRPAAVAQAGAGGTAPATNLPQN
ncbi:hypothetical protein SEA_ENALISNAILO_41 [Gordonia phage EnalisNailo]|nr:hypothetical protein SEA_LILAS_44 [Gordonia phage Lilas]QAY17569.1 hypothetical protein SEA_BRADISSA_42 [Gordonia phage Bradissa]QDB74393.1 hypothetical protein SEA_ENALISNAILO_41 [Gordonia phage EnalisNailo]